jgi:TolA-binding protein
MLRRSVPIILLLLLPVALFAQADQLREGLQFFKQGQYQDSIRSFRALIFNSENQQGRVAEAYYWISRAYLAISNYEEAARNLEYYLEHYASHPYYGDALYQKGRLLYLQDDFESSIQVLERFAREYPDSEYVGSAFFWSGECLFSLGQLEEAARMFNRVIVEYPASVKSEAARYRLSLIEYKKREDEILRLLKWSHEEALNSVEEFKRREKAYEQAVDVYQRRLSTTAPGAVDSTTLAQLRSENEALKSRILALEAQLAESAAKQQIGAIQNREKALQIKEDALAVKEALLLDLPQESEQGQ